MLRNKCTSVYLLGKKLENASEDQDGNCVISMCLMSFNINFMFGYACFMRISLKTAVWLFLTSFGTRPGFFVKTGCSPDYHLHFCQICRRAEAACYCVAEYLNWLIDWIVCFYLCKTTDNRAMSTSQCKPFEADVVEKVSCCSFIYSTYLGLV